VILTPCLQSTHVSLIFFQMIYDFVSNKKQESN